MNIICYILITVKITQKQTKKPSTPPEHSSEKVIKEDVGWIAKLESETNMTKTYRTKYPHIIQPIHLLPKEQRYSLSSRCNYS